MMVKYALHCRPSIILSFSSLVQRPSLQITFSPNTWLPIKVDMMPKQKGKKSRPSRQVSESPKMVEGKLKIAMRHVQPILLNKPLTYLYSGPAMARDVVELVEVVNDAGITYQSLDETNTSALGAHGGNENSTLPSPPVVLSASLKNLSLELNETISDSSDDEPLITPPSGNYRLRNVNHGNASDGAGSSFHSPVDNASPLASSSADNPSIVPQQQQNQSSVQNDESDQAHGNIQSGNQQQQQAHVDGNVFVQPPQVIGQQGLMEHQQQPAIALNDQHQAAINQQQPANDQPNELNGQQLNLDQVVVHPQFQANDNAQPPPPAIVIDQQQQQFFQAPANDLQGGLHEQQQQAARNDIVVWIGHVQHPLVTLTVRQMQILIVRVREVYNRYAALGHDDVLINATRPLNNTGVVEIRLADDRSYQWLTEAARDVDIGVPIQGRIIDQQRPPRRIRFTIKMFAEEIQKRALLLAIQQGNPGLNTQEWSVVSQKRMEDGYNMLVTVALTEQAAEQLERDFRRRVRIGFNGIVEMRRVGAAQAEQEQLIGFNMLA